MKMTIIRLGHGCDCLTWHHDFLPSPVELLVVISTERIHHGNNRWKCTSTNMIEIEHALQNKYNCIKPSTCKFTLSECVWIVSKFTSYYSPICLSTQDHLMVTSRQMRELDEYLAEVHGHRDLSTQLLYLISCCNTLQSI